MGKPHKVVVLTKAIANVQLPRFLSAKPSPSLSHDTNSNSCRGAHTATIVILHHVDRDAGRISTLIIYRVNVSPFLGKFLAIRVALLAPFASPDVSDAKSVSSRIFALTLYLIYSRDIIYWF